MSDNIREIGVMVKKRGGLKWLMKGCDGSRERNNPSGGEKKCLW